MQKSYYLWNGSIVLFVIIFLKFFFLNELSHLRFLNSIVGSFKKMTIKNEAKTSQKHTVAKIKYPQTESSSDDSSGEEENAIIEMDQASFYKISRNFSIRRQQKKMAIHL